MVCCLISAGVTAAGNSQKGDGRTDLGDGNFEMGDSNFIETTALPVSVFKRFVPSD